MPHKSYHHGSFEIRTVGDDDLDEICVNGASVHIEQMSSTGWFMGIDAGDVSFNINFGTERAPVVLRAEEDKIGGAFYASREWKARYAPEKLPPQNPLQNAPSGASSEGESGE